jgi:hypothetical protein
MRIGYHPEPYWWNFLIGFFRIGFTEHISRHGSRSSYRD